jgi:hypothetical protein
MPKFASQTKAQGASIQRRDTIEGIPVHCKIFLIYLFPKKTLPSLTPTYQEKRKEKKKKKLQHSVQNYDIL